MTYERAIAPDTLKTGSAHSPLPRGAAVDRYVILDRLGEGGMGVVYAAYDPRLDRRVALKFLLPPEVNRDGAREKRLLREARAMARLSHPNVAVAYEVGTFQNHVFLAMEFVDGVDLRAWLAEKRRSVADILDLFRAAGRGLAAAHAAGIIHRDFKPENVLVDRHDRPRVTDFGLSRASHGPADEDPVEAVDVRATPPAGHLFVPITATGRVLGTPSYMAPEQHVGDQVDARSDQFAFCVALREALYGEHPFGEIPAERVANAIAGRAAPAPAPSSVPRRCRQAIQRGLAAAPADRFASMEALLAALAPHPKSRWRLVAVAALVGFMVAGTGGYFLSPSGSAASSSPRCDLGAERLSGIWDPGRRSQVLEAFRRSGARSADVTWNGFSGIVDQRARAWAAMHDQACAATHVDGRQSPAILDLRMECLERKRQEMNDLVGVYSEKLDARVLDGAVAAADKLSSVAACGDVANLRAVVPLPDDPATLARVRSIRQRLSHSRALYDAGRYQQGREYMASLKREADAVGYAPLAAEAANALAVHLARAGKRVEAEKLLMEAAKHAVDGRDWNQEAEAWLELLGSYGRDGEVREAHVAARVAEMAVSRANGDASMHARLASNLADAELVGGNLKESLRLYQRAAELGRESRGVGSLRYGQMLNDIGSALGDLGRGRDALGYGERALELQAESLRPDHPDIAASIKVIGVAQVQLGLLEKGRDMLQRAAEIYQRELGPEHPLTTRALQSVALVDAYLGFRDRSLERHADLLAIRTRVLAPHDVYLGTTYVSMGTVQTLADRIDEAERSFRQVIELEARAGLRDGLGTAHALTSLGLIHNGRRLHRQGLDECRRGLDLLSRRLAADSPMLLDARECIGEALIAAGDLDAARAELERAALSIEAKQLGPQWTAGARFQLARAMWGTPADRPRARELARATLDELARAEGDNRKMIARVRGWLSAAGDSPGR